MIGLGDTVGQHGLLRRRAQRLGRGLKERIGTVTRRQQDQPRIGTELPRPHGQRPGPARTDFCTPRSERLGQDEHRVDRAKFSKERDRFRSRRAEIKQRATAAQRPGETHGLDEGVLNQRGADNASAALHERENTRMQVAGLRAASTASATISPVPGWAV